MLMALSGKGREALPYIDRAIELKGLQPDLLDTRGVVYLKAGDSQHAIDDLEKAIAAAPSPAKYFHLAQAYLGAKNKEKAKQSLATAKIKGWEESGLEPLEHEAYRKVLTELGAP
jgi:tetratricopeptide (TPR) repeat protein